MAFVAKPKRSIWMNGLQSEEPGEAERQEQARRMSERLGEEIVPPPIRRPEDLELRPPQIMPPDSLAEFCFTDNYERALHAKGDRLLEIRGVFANPPDVVAHPRTEPELEAVLDWCLSNDCAVIPYGGGSSVVDGVTPPEGYDRVVTLDMDQMDRVLEVDETSRAARIQAGVYGPALEDCSIRFGTTMVSSAHPFLSVG